MFGAINHAPIFLVLASVAAILSDLILRKIFNWFTVSLALVGIVNSCFFSGLTLWGGLYQSLGGLLVAFLLVSWMFWLRFLGGGDVKYLMALGTWGGPEFIIHVGILAILLGGGFAMVSLALRGRLFNFFRKLTDFILSVCVPGLEAHYSPIDLEDKIPYGVMISLAVMITVARDGGLLQ